MRTMSLRWTTSLLTVAALLVVASAFAAEPGALSLGQYSKTGDVITLATQKVSQEPAEKRSLIGLFQLGAEGTALLCYETTEDGVVGILGNADVVFAEKASLADLKKVPAEKWTETFAKFKPIDLAEAKELRKEKPDAPRPRNPVSFAPGIQLVPVVGRPSDFVACKAKGEMYLVQIIEKSENPASVKLKLHPLK